MNKKVQKIQDLPYLERPREKLLAKGAAALSDLELLAVLLGRGSRGRTVFELASAVLSAMHDQESSFSPGQLDDISGLGDARIAAIAAAMEFARRRIQPKGYLLKKPTDALALIQHYADRKQEHFLAITVNGAHEVIANRLITVGLVNRSQVHPREVFADAITDRASGIVVAHNHPSGSLRPSTADKEVTQRLKAAGSLLGIQLLDHIVFTQTGHFSFSEAGLL